MLSLYNRFSVLSNMVRVKIELSGRLCDSTISKNKFQLTHVVQFVLRGSNRPVCNALICIDRSSGIHKGVWSVQFLSDTLHLKVLILYSEDAFFILQNYRPAALAELGLLRLIEPLISLESLFEAVLVDLLIITAVNLH